MKFKFFFILFLIFTFSGIAQNKSKENNNVEKKNEIQVIARVSKRPHITALGSKHSYSLEETK